MDYVTPADKSVAPITSERFDRALSQSLTVERLAENLYDVGSSNDGVPYRVDLQTGACECADARYRDVLCKHGIACAIRALTDTEHTDDATRVTVRVAAYAHRTGRADDCLNAGGA